MNTENYFINLIKKIIHIYLDFNGMSTDLGLF